MSLTSSNSNRNSIKLRIVFLGDQGVGKSSIIQRYTSNLFDEAHNNTVGIDFNVKDLNRYGVNYRLQMWDTAGQERYRSLIPTYLKNAHCVVHVFDVTKHSTLEGVKSWQQLFLEHQQAPGILVANKTDLTNARKVTREEGQQLAKQLKLSYCEVSAKTGRKISQVFDAIVDMMNEERKKQVQFVQSSRQKMKQMKTIEQHEGEQAQHDEQREGKKMSLKARGLALAKRLKCCSDS